jgi:pilus assembly protein CpaC
VTSTADNTLAATISNLFPKLNAARSAGYARVVQSGMVVTKDKETANINKKTDIPYAVGTGDFTRPATASVGFSMEVTPKILEQEKVEMGIGIDVNLQAATSTSNTPISTTNKVKTTVVIKSKESAAIGGIVQNQSTTAYDKDDPDPPAEGTTSRALFRIIRSKNHQISRNQYVMFLTPEIVESATAGTEEIRKKFRRRGQ